MFFLRAEKILERAVRIAALLSGGMAFVASFLMVAQALGRYVFRHPVPGTVEGCRWALPGMIALALAFTMSSGGHVSVDILPMRYRGKTKTIASIVSLSLSFLFSLGMLIASFRYAIRQLNIGEFIPGFPDISTFPFLILIPIGFFLLTLQNLLLLVKAARPALDKGVRGTKQAPEVGI